MLDTSNDVLQQVTALRQKLIDLGFEPIAVRSGEKRPADTAWQRRPLSAKARVGETNTGLRCGTIIAADIDIDDPIEVDEAVAAVERVVGPTPLIRWRESSPRVVMVYRAGEEMKKRVLPVGSGKIEFLAEGQQFVSHGTHPCGDTFQWREMGPEDIDAAALPTITGAAIDEIGRILGVEPQGAPEGALASFEAQVQPVSVAPASAAQTGRERAWALAALEGVVAEIAATPEGSRSDTLNKGAFRLGGIVARGWLSAVEAEEALRGAVVGWANPRKTLSTLRRGLREGQKTPHPDLRDDDGDAIAEERRNRLAEELDAATSVVSTESNSPAQRAELIALPFVWHDPAEIERRHWLYGMHYIRGFVSATFAPGGVGKSTLVTTEALAMVVDRPLLGIHPDERCRVWLWQGEDSLDEMQRRITAIMLHFDIAPSEIEGRLFVNSGRDRDLRIAIQDRNGVRVAEPVVERVIEEIRRNRIDAMIVDPFVSTHAVSENDNPAIDRVSKTWARIAHETNCAIELVHHSRKQGGEQTTVEDGRGASALLATVRSARVLNLMTKDEAARAGVDNPLSYVRLQHGKANLAARAEHAWWLKLTGEPLGNGPLGTEGDWVGVMEPWRWPNPLDGVTATDLDKVLARIRKGQDEEDWRGWRSDAQAVEWVGHAVAEALGIDISSPAGKSRVKAMLKIWLASGALKTRVGQDKNRRSRTFVDAGTESSE